MNVRSLNSNNNHSHSSDFSNGETENKFATGKRSSLTTVGYSLPTSSLSTTQNKNSRLGNYCCSKKSSKSKECLKNSQIFAQSIAAAEKAE
ncbi:MAG: hypothetical protein H7281_06595 [Bacteriovorax sp.]|nr:hypothetical protein [Bacteriovorax sp.]